MDRYVSLNRVLEEVYQNEGYSSELSWANAVSWVGKVLALIKVPILYHEKTTGNSLLTPHITISDYRGDLPIDFAEQMPAGVRDHTTHEVYDYATDSFRTRPAIEVSDPISSTGRKTYVIRNSYIETSEKTVTLEMAYKAFMIDDDGFPMIPDDERVINAVVSYIIFRVDHKLWRQGKLADKVYHDSEQEWLFNLPSAQTSLRNMAPDRREIWTRQWTRLLPVISAYDYSFAYFGTREQLNIGFNDIK